MIKFSILILTYNRPNLVWHSVESVLNQTYPNFEILLFDNGSQPPVSITKFSDERIRYFRYENNIEPNLIGDIALNEMTGTHFLFLADDDALVPCALENVKTFFETSPEIETLNTGFVHFDHSCCKICESTEILQNFTGKIEIFNAKEAMLHYFNGYWGIGEKKDYKGPRMAHSSGCFIKKSLIDKTREIQKDLFVKTFGDVGYVGTLLYTNNLFYLDLPLAIIGQTNNSDSAGIRLGNRMKIDQRYKKNLEYSPLKGLTFINVGTDTHLRVIHRNNIENKMDCRLRPDFYFNHLQSIISDSPWTKQTIRDIIEVIPQLSVSLVQFRSKNGICHTVSSLVQIIMSTFSDFKQKYTFRSMRNSNIQENLSTSESDSNKNQFADINDTGKWIADNYVISKLTPYENKNNLKHH
jgi:glycosyltransferase involved in cell wall biosynthesis